MKHILDWQAYLDTAVQTVAEGIVMLENKNHTLPLDPQKEIALFGRMQLHYYKSGTGSGGMVNVSKVVTILDGLQDAGVKINQKLLKIYQEWDAQNPYDLGMAGVMNHGRRKKCPCRNLLCRKLQNPVKQLLLSLAGLPAKNRITHLQRGLICLRMKKNRCFRL